MTDGEGNPTLSVIVPVKDEEESVAALAAEVTQALNASGRGWECIWVNDGSTDGTQAVLERLCQDDSHHRFLELDGNFGQSAALAAGFAAAKADTIATLDGDGQNDPRDLLRLLDRIDRGDVDMVNGVRQKRRDSFARRICSRIANGFRNWATEEKVSDVGCAIRVCRRECLSGIIVFRGMHRFLPTLVRMRGYRIAEVPVSHRPRTKGKTKYGVNNRLWVGLADTFAVRWMQKRLVHPRVRKVGGGFEPEPRTSPRDDAER